MHIERIFYKITPRNQRLGVIFVLKWKKMKKKFLTFNFISYINITAERHWNKKVENEFQKINKKVLDKRN